MQKYNVEESQQGMASLVILIFLAAIMLLSISFADMACTQLKMNDNHVNYIKALYIAEGGIQRGLWLIENDVTWQPDPDKGYLELLDQPEEFFIIHCKGSIQTGNIITFIVTGVVQQEKRSIEVQVEIGEHREAHILKGSWREIFPEKEDLNETA